MNTSIHGFWKVVTDEATANIKQFHRKANQYLHLEEVDMILERLVVNNHKKIM